MGEKAVDRRGVNRGIFSALFDDLDYQRLSADARLVLLTARLCKDAGPGVIFRCYPETLARQTGLSVRRVRGAIDALQTARWVVHADGVLWVRNGLRWDPNIRLSDDKHRKSVLRSLAALPRSSVVLSFCDYYQLPRPFEGPGETYVPRSKEEGRRNPLIPHEVETAEPTAAAPQAARVQGPAAELHGPVPQATIVRKVRRPMDPTPEFEAFYAAYPRHESRQSALAAWLTLVPANGLVERIMAAVPKHVARWQRLATPKDKIPHPATWLNAKRWEDEIEDVSPEPHASYPRWPS